MFFHLLSFGANCGPDAGNTVCTNGNCCSPGGFCGLDWDSCGFGCQAEFGRCGKGFNGICDPLLGNTDCVNGCCSPSGFCGTTAAYCNQTAVPPLHTQCVNERQVHLSIVVDNRVNAYVQACQKLSIPCSFLIPAPTTTTEIDYSYDAIVSNNYSLGIQFPSGSFASLSESQILNKMKTAAFAVYNLTGKYPSIVRPYYEYKNETIRYSASQLYMQTLFLNVDTQDYLFDSTDTEGFMANLKNNLKDAKSAIISSSDSSLLLSKLGELYNYFQYRGFEFVSAEQCTGTSITMPKTLSSPPSNGLCGPLNGNKQCPLNQCCSYLGYCGTSNLHCYENLQCLGQCKGSTGYKQAIKPQTKVISSCLNKKHVALTFSDAPGTQTTATLNTLVNLNVSATFFLDSISALNSVSAVQNITRLGFQVEQKDQWTIPASFSINTFNTKTNKQTSDIKTTSVNITSIKYIRPLYNGYDSNSITGWNSLQFYVTLFDIDSYDWDTNMSTQAVFSRIKQELLADSVGGHIIACGSQQPYCNAALPQIVALFKQYNYSFVNMTECMGFPV